MIRQPQTDKRGQFLWMPRKHRERYIRALRKRIQGGYYSDEQIISAICDKLAPVFDDEAERAA